MIDQTLQTAENYVNTGIDTAVISVPVPFLNTHAKSTSQDPSDPCQQLDIAAKEAGFRHVHFISDPIAAILAYRLDDDPRTISAPEKVMYHNFMSQISNFIIYRCVSLILGAI